MPEGDSYTHASARISPLLIGRSITAVEGSSPSVRRHSGAMLHQRVTAVRTIGKHLIIDLESGMSAHVQLGMSGRVIITAPDRTVGRSRGAARLALTTDRGTVWIMGAPTVQVDRRRSVDRSIEHLGPDLLSAEFDSQRFRRLAERYPGDRTVSDFLLDQRVMAGIGNEYKCEVLFLEGIAPHRPVESVSIRRLEDLADRARRLMTLNAHRLPRSTTGRSGSSLWVYGRSGQPCRRCRTAVNEAWVGRPPRITYWCPACQT
jgi:endonuclease-8